MGKKMFQDYCAMYKKYRLPFWVGTRPETVNEDNAKMLADLNCARVTIGLQSGNEEFRRKILKRTYSNRRMVEVAKILRKHGISFSMDLIIGFPFETRKMIFEGIELLRKIKPDGISAFLFTPYKGSALRQVCEDNNMIDKDLVAEDYFQMKYALRNNSIGQGIVGLWRTLSLYVHLPKSRYPLIRKAEALSPDGDKIFEKLKKEYCEQMGWTNNP